MTNHITQDDCIFTFNESSSVAIHFLLNTASQACFVLHLINLESLVIILTNAILVVPEVSNERSVLTYFSLVLPNVVHFFHCLIRNSILYIWVWTFEFISEWFDEIFHSLSFIVDSWLLEVINDPFKIIRWDLDFIIFQFHDLLLSAFVHFFFERPTFFYCILDFMICWLNIFYVEIWYHFISSWEDDFRIFEKSAWDFQLCVSIFHVIMVDHILELVRIYPKLFLYYILLTNWFSRLTVNSIIWSEGFLSWIFFLYGYCGKFIFCGASINHRNILLRYTFSSCCHCCSSFWHGFTFLVWFQLCCFLSDGCWDVNILLLEVLHFVKYIGIARTKI